MPIEAGTSPAYDALLPQQQQFLARYLTSLNATQAYRRVYPDSGCPAQHAHRALQSPPVRRALEELLDAMGATPTRISTAMAEIAFGCDLADFQPLLDGVSLDDARQGVPTHLIRKLKVRRRTIGKGDHTTRIEEFEIQLYDRVKALIQLAKARGMLSHGRQESPSDPHLATRKYQHHSDRELVRLIYSAPPEADELACIEDEPLQQLNDNVQAEIQRREGGQEAGPLPVGPCPQSVLPRE